MNGFVFHRKYSYVLFLIIFLLFFLLFFPSLFPSFFLSSFIPGRELKLKTSGNYILEPFAGF